MSKELETKCDHILGFTFDYEGPSIFQVSDGDQSDALEYEQDGIVYWNYCPKCGERINLKETS